MMQEQKQIDLQEVLRHLPRLVSPENEKALRAAGLEVRKEDTAGVGGRTPVELPPK